MDRRANFKIPRKHKININAVKYYWKNLVLDLDNSARAKLYDGNQLVFLGDGYMALKMFITRSGNDPAVQKSLNLNFKCVKNYNGRNLKKMQEMEWRVIDIKQRIADMKLQLQNKSNNVKPDPQPVLSKKSNFGDLLQNVVQSATSQDQYASVLHNREMWLRERIQEVRKKIEPQK